MSCLSLMSFMQFLFITIIKSFYLISKATLCITLVVHTSPYNGQTPESYNTKSIPPKDTGAVLKYY